MKIGIFIGHPTQFEGPFFQFVSKEPEHELRVVFTAADRMRKVYDPDLRETISWGIDLLSGYSHAVLPRRMQLFWLAHDLATQKYDFLIVNGYNKRAYILTTFLAKLFKIRVALRLDSVLFQNESHRKIALKVLMFMVIRRLYQHFFAVGSLTAQYLERFGVPRRDISFFTYVVDVDYFKKNATLSETAKRKLKERYGIPGGARVIISVAKFDERESPWDLLRAFSANPPPNTWLLLVGDGPERDELESYFRTSGCEKAVFAGYVQYPDLPAHYGMSDLFVHPALDEPWGVSVAEALASGLPVIASTRVGAAHDLIEPGENGFLYEAGNVRDLEDKLDYFLGTHDRSGLLGTNERVLARWNHVSTWENIVLAAGEQTLDSPESPINSHSLPSSGAHPNWFAFVTRVQEILHRSLILYMRWFPITKGKERLLDFLWRPLSFRSYVRETKLHQADVRVRCDLTRWLQRHIYFFGAYEPRNCDIWVRIAQESRTIFDIGANVGLYSLLAARINPGAAIHSFEPSPDVYARFLENAQLNDFSRITPNKLAVAQSSGTGFLHVCAGVTGDNEGMNYVSNLKIEQAANAVTTVSIEDYCDVHQISQIDLMKLDIEGGEYDALCGARALLERQAIGCLLLEFSDWAAARSGHTIHQIKQLLANAGYDMYIVEAGTCRAVVMSASHDGDTVLAFPRGTTFRHLFSSVPSTC